MTVSIADLVTFADNTTSDLNEAANRAAISRAYYAAYHDCCNFENALAEIGIEKPLPDGTPVRGMHRKLIARLASPSFANSHEKRLRSSGRAVLMRSLYSSRLTADYFLDEEVTEEEARQTIANVRLVLAKV